MKTLTQTSRDEVFLDISRYGRVLSNEDKTELPHMEVAFAEEHEAPQGHISVPNLEAPERGNPLVDDLQRMANGVTLVMAL